MMPFYKAEVIDNDGKTIQDIGDIISVDAARAFNTNGSLTLVIPNTYARAAFHLHTRLKLWRHDYQGVPRNFGKTVWFMKKLDHFRDEGTYTLSFVDSLAMLDTRLVGYTADGPYANKTLEEYELITYNDTLRLDNMMRAYVRENLGPLALDSRRIIPIIRIEDDRSLGAYGEKQAAWQEIGPTLVDLAGMSAAKGVPLFYDLIPEDDGAFMFRVWTGTRGLDRSGSTENPLLLTAESGFIGEIHEIEDYADVASFCWALGEGSGGSQLLETGENLGMSRSDPFGRIEMTISASDTSNITVLGDTAISALSGKLPKQTLTCKVFENSALVLGRDIDYGDKVTVQIGSSQYDCTLNAISTSWKEGEETLDLRLAGEVPIGSPAIFQEIIIPDPPPDPDPETPNTAPVVDAGPDQGIAWYMGVIMAGTASDDGLPNPPANLTYGWSQVSGPSTASITAPASLTTFISFPTSGTYVFRLTAYDGDLTTTDDMTVVVGPRDNEAPVVHAGPDQSIESGDTLHLSGSATDDGQPDPPSTLTYLWTLTGGPASVIFDDDTNPETDVAYTLSGLYSFRLTVSDSALSAYDELFVVIGEPGNEAPEVDAGPDQTISWGMGVIMAGGVLDDGLPNPPATTLYEWTQTGGPAVASITDRFSLTTFVSFPATGLYSFRLTADDSELTTYDEMFVQVNL